MTANGVTPRTLTKHAARVLTDRIAAAADYLWQLLAQAHDGGAWRALGYDTWGAYVDAEFDISRGQAYRLLDQARVAGALEAAVGEPVAVSARQAAVLRHEPERAAKRTAKRVAKGEPVEVAVAREVERVRSARTSKQGEGGDGRSESSTTPGPGRGAAPAAEKAGEARAAAPKPARSGTASGGEEPGPAPSPPGAPATQEGVRHMIAMVTTTGADVIAHCATEAAIASAIATLRTALAKVAKPKAGLHTTAPKPLARREVTPIPKGGKR